MKAWLRPAAEADLLDRTSYYRSVGGADLGVRFFDSAVAALRSVERMPSIGSPLVGELCHIPGLRSCPVKRFPVRWYYLVADGRVDVVRLLADAQDLAVILRTDDDASP